MHGTIPRRLPSGFVRRNLDMLSSAASRAMAVGGSMDDLELHSFRDAASARSVRIFTDENSFGGFSTAAMEAVQVMPGELPHDFKPGPGRPLPHYGRFHGKINIDLPLQRLDIERSGFAAWRTADPGWTLLGKAVLNCEAHAFLALRVRADNSRYFVNLQADTMITTDLFQHRLFAKTPGEWETIYIPFTEFVKTRLGRLQKTQGHIPKRQITTVGLGLIDRIPGPFELCIDRIWSTSTRDFGDH